MGQLRGILLTPTLRSIIEEVLALPQAEADEVADLGAVDDPIETAHTTDAPSPAREACSTPAASLARVKAMRQSLLSPKVSIETATSLLEATCDNYDKGDAMAVVPLDQIMAVKHLILASSSDSNEAHRLLTVFHTSIRPTTLIYERTSSKGTAHPTFQKRMARLRQLSEETSYRNATSNLQMLNAHSTRDDVNVKSMMYATSVGLNMIVAPVSFGVFMYFFAGSLFGKFFPQPPQHDHPRTTSVDIRQVIAGVLSGVTLLFIEMILFVIRSHELDASVRMKERKSEYRSNPFGYTKKAMERTYQGEMD